MHFGMQDPGLGDGRCLRVGATVVVFNVISILVTESRAGGTDGLAAQAWHRHGNSVPVE